MIFKAPKLVLLFFIFINQIYPQQPQHSKKVIGYYAQWAIYARDYNVLDVEADKLTHLLYAFYNPVYNSTSDTASLESLDEYADYQHNESGLHAWDTPVKGNIGDLKLLKQNFPHLKVLISVGGWTRSQGFPAIAASANARATFTQSMIDFLTKYPWIDGFDFDWEFPIIGGTDGNESVNGGLIEAQPHTADDHKNFVYLLKAVREGFDAAGMTDKEVSISMGNNVVNAAAQFIGPANQASNGMTNNIMDYCDFVSFFGYDFGGNWNDKTCYNAPLFGGDNPNDPLHNPSGRNQVLDELVNVYLTDVGIPADKLIMGLPFYGKIFEGVASTGVDPDNPGLYETAPRLENSACRLPQAPLGTWDAKNCEHSGSIEFCDLYQGIGTNTHHYLDASNPLEVSTTAATAGWVRYWDDVAKVPYLYNATQNKFISYDDAESIDLKVNYALSQQLGGVMIWELSQDARESDNGLLDVVDASLLEVPYDITLSFKKPDDSPISGVEVQLKNGSNVLLETLNSDSNGQVKFVEIDGYNAYNLSYTYSGYSFLPSSVSYEAEEFDSDKVVTITGSDLVYSIQGSVKENGQLLSNTEVVLKDADNNELKKVAAANGNFTINSVIGNLDYSLVAEKDYYSFTSIDYTNLNSNQTNQELTATRNSYSISGNVTAENNALPGVTITVSGNNETYTATTDVDGNYTISKVPAGYSYTVTPSFNTVVFLPTEISFNSFNSNSTANFKENLGLIYGTVKQGTTAVSGAKVSLIVPWTDAMHGYQNIIKTTNADGEYFYTKTELDGYSTISTLKLETWLNSEVTYYPTDLTNIAITVNPQEYNFNSEPVNPVIEIKKPNQTTLTVNYQDPVPLEALVELSYDDGETTLNSVVFEIDDASVTDSNTGDVYTGSWSPEDSDYGTTHTFKVTAESSNGESAEETVEFNLICQGANCPNIAPKIKGFAPTNTTINQNNGFQNIPIQVTVTDSDGSVSTVTISIAGATAVNMSSGSNDTYSYNFTPTNYQEYSVGITATDNEGASATYNTTLKVIDSQFVPLPSGNIILGYAHSWENASAPFLYFNDMLATKYNVIMYSFIETEGQNGYTPQLTINSNRYVTNGTFDPQLLKDDINSLREEGIPVIASIGGQNGHVELNTVAEKNEFVQGLKDIIDEYGFDGIDLDFEGGSMDFGAGALTDFSYTGISAFPKLKNVVDAFKEIKQHYGSNFILTCAPETFYVQVGSSTYSDTAGAFLPVIHNLRDELDLVMVQLYNTGSINALDGQAYSQATPDFLTSMSDMLITGFDVASTGFHFDGLPDSKIMVGIPACPDAAPSGGYLQPSETLKALDYMRFGTTFTGRNYTLQNGAHPNLRGVMTWSVNWDAAVACASEYEFSSSYFNYFNSTASVDEGIKEDLVQIYPNPFENSLTINSPLEITGIQLFDLNGKKLYHKLKLDSSVLNLSALESGLYILELKTKSNLVYTKILKK